jgi:hypothetical protein
MIDIDSCTNDRARMFVRSMGFSAPYLKTYSLDGIIPSIARNAEGLLQQTHRASGTVSLV